MNTLISVVAQKVTFSDKVMVVHLSDGRSISVPLDWFPALENASKEALENWRFIGGGDGIHWEDLDEDISIAGLLKA